MAPFTPAKFMCDKWERDYQDSWWMMYIQWVVLLEKNHGLKIGREHIQISGICVVGVR